MSTDGTALTVQNAGYYEGVTDVYYALMTGMDARNQAPVYGPAVCAGKSIEVQAAPNYRERKVYASNVAKRRDQLPESYTVTLNLDQVIPAVRKVLLGRRDGGNGVELITGKNVGPWVALLFAATLDDGSLEYRQLYKGRFSEPTATHHTKNDGDSYQHPTITGTFVRLGNNDQIGTVLNDGEDHPEWLSTVQQRASEDLILKSVQLYRGSGSSRVDATCTPPINDRITEYQMVGTKTAANQGWTFTLSLGTGVTVAAKLGTNAVRYSNGVTVTYDFAGLKASGISVSLLSGGSLQLYSGAAGQPTVGSLPVTVEKGGERNIYTFTMRFAPGS